MMCEQCKTTRPECNYCGEVDSSMLCGINTEHYCNTECMLKNHKQLYKRTRIIGYHEDVDYDYEEWEDDK